MSFFWRKLTRSRTTHPPCLAGELEFTISFFSQPRLPLISLERSAGGSHSMTAFRWASERTVVLISCAIAMFVWDEGSARSGRNILRQSNLDPINMSTPWLKEFKLPRKDSSVRPWLHSANRGSMFEDQVEMDQRLQQWPWTTLVNPALMQILVAQDRGVSCLTAQRGTHEEHSRGSS